MKKEKPALQDIKQITKIIKDMTKWENIRFSLLFIGMVVGIPIAIFVVGFLSKEFYEFMVGLYKSADDGDKFNGIITLLTVFIGVMFDRLYLKVKSRQLK